MIQPMTRREFLALCSLFAFAAASPVVLFLYFLQAERVVGTALNWKVLADMLTYSIPVGVVGVVLLWMVYRGLPSPSQFEKMGRLGLSEATRLFIEGVATLLFGCLLISFPVSSVPQINVGLVALAFLMAFSLSFVGLLRLCTVRGWPRYWALLAVAIGIIFPNLGLSFVVVLYLSLRPLSSLSEDGQEGRPSKTLREGAI